MNSKLTDDHSTTEHIRSRRRGILKGLGVLTTAALISPGSLAAKKTLSVTSGTAEAMLEGKTDMFPAQGIEPTQQQMIYFLRASNHVGKRAMASGHHPFGAVVVAPDQQTILLTQGNGGTVLHAEATLARIASENYSPEFLWGCTLYTAVKPCCMCSGTIYWANIGRVVYCMTETQLLSLTGDHKENPTMSIPARYVFQHGQKDVKVMGPIPEVADETVALQKSFWLQQQRGTG